MNKILIFLIPIILSIFLYKKYYDSIIYPNWLIFFIFIRGLITTDCHNWTISNKFLKDASGIDFYNNMKKKYGKLMKINFAGKTSYLVMDINIIKFIMDHSPDLFGVGYHKYNFFKSFMPKNVGVSEGCPWRSRRIHNENVLFSDTLHIYADHYNQIIEKEMSKKIPIDFNEFAKFGQIVTSKIVFGDDKLINEVYKVFSEASSLKSIFLFHQKKINKKIFTKYQQYLMKNIDSPLNKSLIYLATLNRNKINTNRINIDHSCQNYLDKLDIDDEIFNQIPHWIFPIAGLLSTHLMRLLTFLCNNPRKLEILLDQIKKLDNHRKIYNNKYLRACVLETFRLNNPVTTTFRTILEDTKIDGKLFLRDTQFLILNNPVMRDPKAFKQPHMYIPERWINSKNLENSYYSIMFNQGPQKCPGKELAILLLQLATYHYLKNINKLDCSMKYNKDFTPQMLNPCTIKFKIN